MLAGIRHREDKGVVADRDVGEGVARSKEQFPEAVHVLAAFDTVLDPSRERHIADKNGQSGIAPEFSTEIEGADLPLAQRRPVANKAGRIGSVFGKPQLVALTKNLRGGTLTIIERVVLGDFDGRMRQFRVGRKWLARGIEDVAVAELNCGIHPSARLARPLQQSVLLVLRQFVHALRLDQLLQSQETGHLPAHLVDLGFFRNDEDQIVAQLAEAGPVGPHVLVDTGDQFGHRVHCCTDGNAVVRHEGEQGLAAPNLVGDINRSRRERNELELALEIEGTNPVGQVSIEPRRGRRVESAARRSA